MTGACSSLLSGRNDCKARNGVYNDFRLLKSEESESPMSLFADQQFAGSVVEFETECKSQDHDKDFLRKSARTQ